MTLGRAGCRFEEGKNRTPFGLREREKEMPFSASCGRIRVAKVGFIGVVVRFSDVRACEVCEEEGHFVEAVSAGPLNYTPTNVLGYIFSTHKINLQ